MVRDYGFRLINVDVDTLAKIQFHTEQETGEITPELLPSNKPDAIKKSKLILDPDGCIVYPQSLYLITKLRGENKVENVDTIANALLLYTRWLHKSGLTYKHLTEFEEEGAPWMFATDLIKNTRHINSTQNEAYALKTSKTYMRAVLKFYTWMHRTRILRHDSRRVVCEYSDVKVGNYSGSQHDSLSHTYSQSKPNMKSVSNIMLRFPRSDSTPPEKKLKPMVYPDKLVFEQYLELLKPPFPLMFRLAINTGLRIDELANFPQANIGEIDIQGLDVVPVTIKKTKFGKPRTIEIPVDIYDELEIYLYSDQRMKNMKKRKEKLEEAFKNGEKTDTYEGDLLFISNRGSGYKTNSLECHFSTVRKEIRKDYPDWYYRNHDSRSTFATDWLESEKFNRKVGFDFLMDELKHLMGHSK